MVLGYGISAGGGVYLTPGFGNSAFDFGGYLTYGTGYGFDPSASISGAVNTGGSADLRGVASNANLGFAIGAFGAGESTTYVDGKIAGVGGSVGIKGVPAVAGGTGSITNMRTCTLGLSNIQSGFSQAFCK